MNIMFKPIFDVWMNFRLEFWGVSGHKYVDEEILNITKKFIHVCTTKHVQLLYKMFISKNY